MSETSQAIGALKILSEQIHELQVRSEERLKAQHGRFNVFTTLLKAQDEVRLHTRFIHELLNPDGTHDCGDLFLKLFFETLKAHPPIDHDDSATAEPWDGYSEQSYWVGKEVRKGGDQLDLLLESDSHLLVIENKIEAGEQPNQVERYIDYLESRESKVGQVLYLTLNGKQAETHNGKAYLRISYHEHIMAWLDHCLKATYHIVPINQVLIQYQRVVKQLIGQQLEAKTMDTIKEFIRSNPIILQTHRVLSAAIVELRLERKQQIKKLFAEKITISLGDSFTVSPRPKMTESSFAIDENPGLVIQARENDFTDKQPFSVWMEHNRWGALCIGIEAKWALPEPLTKDEAKLLTIMKSEVIEACRIQDLHHAALEKTWWGTFWPVGVHDLVNPFLDDEAVDIFYGEPNRLEELIVVIDAEIRNFMQLLEQAFSKAKELVTEQQ